MKNKVSLERLTPIIILPHQPVVSKSTSSCANNHSGYAHTHARARAIRASLSATYRFIGTYVPDVPGITRLSVVTRLVRSLRVISCMAARKCFRFAARARARVRPLVSGDVQHKSCFRFQFITDECPRTKGTMIYTSVPHSRRTFIA